MRLHKLSKLLFLSTVLLVGIPSASGQSQTGVKADIVRIKAEIVELQRAAVSLPTLSQAVAELSSKLAQLEQKMLVVERSNGAMPDALTTLNSLESEVGRLRTEVEYLRTGIANIEQPAAVSTSGGSATHVNGMQISTADGHYSMILGGAMNARYQLQVPEDFSGFDAAGFSLRRARFGIQGQLGKKALRYFIQSELAQPNAPLLDYYLDWQYRKELTVRVGQSKTPYTRSFLAPGPNRVFHELSLTQELQRYDRDIGVWALGSIANDKLHYHTGLSNGSGPNQKNANIDLAASLRVESALVGKYIKPGLADVKGECEAALTVGAAFVHDLVSVPAILSGIEVGSRDVNADGINDNVRVISTAIDAQFRYKGFETMLEATWRHERWGAILEHDDNRDLANAVSASSSGRRNYIGLTAEASYFVLPKRLLVGGRISHGRLPVLGIGGRTFATPPRAQRALQFDGIVQLYREGVRSLGLSYSLTNFNEKDAPDPANDLSHAVILEAQIVL